MRYIDLSAEEKQNLLQTVKKEYDEYLKQGLKLDFSRGKPNSYQLDISQGMLDLPLGRSDCFSEAGLDCRNYGILDGLDEMKEFFSQVYGVPKDYISVGGNSSLQLMYDTLCRAMLFGVYGSEHPWCREANLKWICVTPGYDRHFRITEKLGFELISVPMKEDGPDMDLVEELVKDPCVKGIWCVPKYSNPTGNTYSDETVRRLVSMECGARDFRIMWDNAYAVHDFDECGDALADIFAEAAKYGTEDRIFYFASTSKITFPGGGVAFMASSLNNKKQIEPFLGAQTIGYDKLNQLRHLKYFKTAENLRNHMLKQGAVIKAKFDITLEALASLGGLGVAEWTAPKGGYFISLDVLPGCAKRVYELLKNAGVTLTAVGATHPYGVDPEDKTLRLAPTYSTEQELKLATSVLVCAIKLASLELLSK